MITFRKDLLMQDGNGLLKVTRGTCVELVGILSLTSNAVLLKVRLGTRTLERGLFLSQVRHLILVP